MPRNHRQHIPVDASVTCTCPVCDDDGVLCYVSYGDVESMECPNGCHRDYSDDERALVEQAAKNAANTELHELEFRHTHRCGADER